MEIIKILKNLIKGNIRFPVRKIFIIISFVYCLIFLYPSKSEAKIISTNVKDTASFNRSIESLRDINYQTWQLVAYPNIGNKENIILRIIGYPGSLRIDHPTSLIVNSGRKQFILNDITLSNPKLAKDQREAAAEFDLSPLLVNLKNKKALRLSLQGVFNELPIPPYLVAEWQYLLTND